MLKYRCTLTSVVYFSSLFVASCPDPGVPQNGQRVGTSFGHGKHLQFYCSSGYWLVGSQLIVCNEGKWSNDIPTCKGRFSIVRTQRDIIVFFGKKRYKCCVVKLSDIINKHSSRQSNTISRRKTTFFLCFQCKVCFVVLTSPIIIVLK